MKEFHVDKVNKQIDITFYSIPLLPVLRNLMLEQQEQGVTLLLPEYAVQISYRKRRFVVPKEYQRHNHKPSKEDHHFSKREDKQEAIKHEESISIAKQLNLFES